MPLLKEVMHRASGLEGLTEDRKWVPLSVPTPCVWVIEKAPNNGVEDLKKEARQEKNIYYHPLPTFSVRVVAPNVSVLPFNIYSRRKLGMKTK